MIHPIPSGTRDVLPDETREVRAITDTLRAVFERHGYGEIYTPALEYESVLARADMAEAQPTYRVFDETGAVLVLRSDMTVPIARVVATRYASSEPPLRFCYFAHCYRGVRPQRGQPRELLQAGHRADRLRRAPGHRRGPHGPLPLARRDRPEGLSRGRRRRVAVPRPDGEPRRARGGPQRACSRRSSCATSWGSSEALERAGITGEAAELLVEVPQRRGGPEVLADAPEQAEAAVSGPAPAARAARARRSPSG